MSEFIKDPDAVLDYGFNWATSWLGADTIQTSTWVVPAGLTEVTSSVSSGISTIWLSGGTRGKVYTVTNRIVTVGGRTDDRSLTITVRDR